MQDLSKYAFVNAKTRAMISGLIPPYFFERLLDSSSTQELLEGLKNTEYFPLVDLFKGIQPDIPLLEKEIIRIAIEDYAKVVRAIPSGKEKELAGLILERYELEEVKVALRLWHNREEPRQLKDYFLLKTISYPLDFKKIISSESFDELLVFFNNTPYKKPLALSAQKYKDSGLVFDLEFALDADYYSRLIERVDSLSDADKKAAGKIIGVEIDIENINLLLRLGKYRALNAGQPWEWFIPGGTWVNKSVAGDFYSGKEAGLGPYEKIKDMAQGNPAVLERFLYDILARQIKAALSGFPFTIGTVLAYFALKRQETKNLIAIFYIKKYGWNKEKAMTVIC